MRLIQTQNPQAVLLILPWWRKYLRKISECYYEGELVRLAEAFMPEERTRFFILVDDDENVRGFATMMIDPAYNNLYVIQVATDAPKEMKREIQRIAQEAGATDIVFITERSPRAWGRLIGCEQAGFVLRINVEE